MLIRKQMPAVSGDRIEVQHSLGTHLFFCDEASTVWRGQERPDFSGLRINSESFRHRRSPYARPRTIRSQRIVVRRRFRQPTALRTAIAVATKTIDPGSGIGVASPENVYSTDLKSYGDPLKLKADMLRVPVPEIAKSHSRGPRMNGGPARKLTL